MLGFVVLTLTLNSSPRGKGTLNLVPLLPEEDTAGEFNIWKYRQFWGIFEAPSPQFWGSMNSKSPKVGGFRGLSAVLTKSLFNLKSNFKEYKFNFN